jgi:hypothetical protein
MATGTSVGGDGTMDQVTPGLDVGPATEYL